MKQINSIVITSKFYFRKYSRCVSILFKKNRKLKKLSFDYFENWQFNNAYLVVDFKFENAIWYRVGQFKSIVSNNPIVLDLSNVRSNKVEIIVYGLFQTQVLTVDIKKRGQVDIESLTINLPKLTSLSIDLVKLKREVNEANKITLKMGKVRPRIGHPYLINNNIEYGYNNFKIN